MVETGGNTFVIDTGPDFRQQMLRESVEDVDAILFTHEHKDHIAGMDDVRGFNFRHKKAMPVYCSERVFEALTREFHYIFSKDKYPGIPEINVNVIHNIPFAINRTMILPIAVMHAKMPVFGFRINDFVYITDANYISAEEKKKIAGCKILVINALRKEKHISHFSLQEALNLIDELKPEKAYLTHISHQLGLHKDVEKELPPNVFLSYDGLKMEL